MDLIRLQKQESCFGDYFQFLFYYRNVLLTSENFQGFPPCGPTNSLNTLLLTKQLLAKKVFLNLTFHCRKIYIKAKNHPKQTMKQKTWCHLSLRGLSHILSQFFCLSARPNRMWSYLGIGIQRGNQVKNEVTTVTSANSPDVLIIREYWNTNLTERQLYTFTGRKGCVHTLKKGGMCKQREVPCTSGERRHVLSEESAPCTC